MRITTESATHFSFGHGSTHRFRGKECERTDIHEQRALAPSLTCCRTRILLSQLSNLTEDIESVLAP